MKIHWRPNEQDYRFIEVLVNDELWRLVYKSLFLKHFRDLKNSKDLKDLEERFLQVEEKMARESALRLLAAKGRFEEEIRQKLSLKGLSSRSIDQAIEFCKRLGYLDDSQEIDLLIQREQRRGMGPQRILLKLKTKKIDRAKLESIRRQLMQQQQTTLENLLTKRSFQKKSDFAKLMRALLRRGFDQESIMSVLRSSQR